MKKIWILLGLFILFGVACTSCQHQGNDVGQDNKKQDESAITTLFGQSETLPAVESQTDNGPDQAKQLENLNELPPNQNNYVNLSTYKGVLTFDDGPHPKTTQVILENLHTANVQNAVFFLVGYRMLEYPYLVQLIDHYGYEIGYHSMFHQELDIISEKKICQEIRSFKKLLNNILLKDYPLKYARPLHSVFIDQVFSYISDTKMGKYSTYKYKETFYQSVLNKNWLQAVKRENLSIMLWHVDFNDWNNPIDLNQMRYFYKGDIEQMWLFHEMPLHFEIMAAFDNKIDQKLPIFLNQLYRMAVK
jgi:peptidoglycan/xylan/chitin deacetylase (PgdA/CDA1 family)